LDDRNLITLCGRASDGSGQNHHLWVGHLDDFQSSNLSVVYDARVTFHGVATDGIARDERWVRKRAKGLKPLEMMTVADRAALLELMDRRMPRR
jgi:hypothetical protein